MEVTHPHSAIPAELSTFLQDFNEDPVDYVSMAYKRGVDINAISQQIIQNLSTLIQNHRQDVHLKYIHVKSLLHMKLPSKEKIVELVLNLLFTAHCPASEVAKIQEQIRTANNNKKNTLPQNWDSLATLSSCFP